MSTDIELRFEDELGQNNYFLFSCILYSTSQFFNERFGYLKKIDEDIHSNINVISTVELEILTRSIR